MSITVRAFLTSSSKPIVTTYGKAIVDINFIKRDALRKYGEDSMIHITIESPLNDDVLLLAYKEHGKKRFRNMSI